LSAASFRVSVHAMRLLLAFSFIFFCVTATTLLALGVAA
jgi:hypothetical protein